MKKENSQDSFLTFLIKEEIFAINVSNVQNILEMSKITKIPRSPGYMAGIINLRGSVLPVIDTRIMMGLEKAKNTVNTCILVVELFVNKEIIRIGAIVDAVREVIKIEEKDKQPPPGIGNKYKSDFITGVTKRNDDFIMMIDAELLFTNEIVEDLNSIEANSELIQS